MGTNYYTDPAGPLAPVKQRRLDADYSYEKFQDAPVCANVAGTAPGAGTNVAAFPTNIFEYFLIGTQTLVAPTISADGLLCSLDLTNNEGVEYTQGITARSRFAFTIGTSPAFFLKVGLLVADVSGSDICAVGFRKAAQAYQADWNDYTDKATLNKVAGDIYSTTALNNVADISTDTTINWADATAKVLEVYVSATGVVTYKVDKVVATTVAYTFDTGDVVVPFFHLLHDATTPGAVTIQSWECGLQ